MKASTRTPLVLLILWITLGICIITAVALSGCQVYSAKVGDVELWSGRVLMFDAKTGLTVDAVDPNFNSILITLDKSEQNPEDITVKANPLLQQYEVGTGGSR